MIVKHGQIIRVNKETLIEEELEVKTVGKTSVYDTVVTKKDILR